MEKPWYAFFGLVPVESVRRVFLRFFKVQANRYSFFLTTLIVLGIVFASVGGSFAAPSETPLPLPSPSMALDADFLLLPAFDIEQSKLQNNSNSIQIGDEIELRVSGIHISGVQNAWKELKVDIPPGVNIHDQGWEINPKPVTDTTPTTDYLISAIPLKPGKLSLPSLALKDGTGKAVGRTNPFTVEVASAIKSTDPKPEQPEELEPPVGLQFPWWILALMGLVGVLFFGIAVWFLVRWLQARKAKKTQKVEIVLSEDEVALAGLTDLERRELLKKGEFKAHYFKVSEILKSYVGARYQFDAPESTTQEMIAFLEEKKIAADSIIDRLEVVFDKLDRVKFTDHSPVVEESIKLIEDAKSFVLSTRRIPAILNNTGVTSNEVR